VQGVTGAAARKGQAHIALRYGRVLLYLEDQAALETLVDAVEAAYELREEVFGGPRSNRIRARVGHSSFERDGKPSVALVRSEAAVRTATTAGDGFGCLPPTSD